MPNCVISNQNYEHVPNVWEAFNMNTMRDYHDLYLKVDVLLLAYVFEIFRKESINCFKLDSAHYISTSGFSWDAMLKFTDLKVKRISEIGKYQFVKSTVRGGKGSMICKEYARANNKFLKSNDVNKPTSYIIYLDANSLYEHSMMQPSQLKYLIGLIKNILT